MKRILFIALLVWMVFPPWIVLSADSKPAPARNLQFCDNVHAKTKEDFVRAVEQWKNCHISKSEFFERFSRRVGENIESDFAFSEYVMSKDREVVPCNWTKKEDVIIYHLNPKTKALGSSSRLCRNGEYILVDTSKHSPMGGALLSGWCLNPVDDKRRPAPSLTTEIVPPPVFPPVTDPVTEPLKVQEKSTERRKTRIKICEDGGVGTVYESFGFMDSVQGSSGAGIATAYSWTRQQTQQRDGACVPKN